MSMEKMKREEIIGSINGRDKCVKTKERTLSADEKQFILFKFVSLNSNL